MPCLKVRSTREKVEEHMKLNNLNNRTLSEKSGVCINSVSRLRSGGYVTTDTMRKICEVFKCKASDLIID